MMLRGKPRIGGHAMSGIWQQWPMPVLCPRTHWLHWNQSHCQWRSRPFCLGWLLSAKTLESISFLSISKILNFSTIFLIRITNIPLKRMYLKSERNYSKKHVIFTRQWSSHCNQRDCSHLNEGHSKSEWSIAYRILEANCAAKEGSNIANDGCEYANGENSHEESEPSIHVVRWRNQSKQQFPEQGHIVQRFFF